MSADLAAFVQRWRGRQVCNHGYCQCVALANEWCRVNGWTPPSGASAGALSFPAPWVRVPLAQARAGDLIQWHSSLPGSDGDGHIGVYLLALSPGFRSFDQNWSCACSLGPCPCCCEIAHQDRYSDLPYVAGAWRWEPPPPPPYHPPTVPPGDYPDGPSWPLQAPDLTGVEL